MSEGLSLQVARIETHLRNEIGTANEPGSLRRQVDDVLNELRSLRKVIVGNGIPGVVGRLDRIEQTENRRKLILSTFGVSVIGLVCKAIWEAIRKGI